MIEEEIAKRFAELLKKRNLTTYKRECLNNLTQTDNGSDTEARIRRVVKMLLGGEIILMCNL